MAGIKALTFWSLFTLGSLSLRAEVLWYLCEVNGNSETTIEISFDRQKDWADGWDAQLDVNSQVPSFTTTAYLHIFDMSYKGSIDITFEPGHSNDYAFLNMTAILIDETKFTMSLMEDESLGTAWGQATLGQRALTLNCISIFEEGDGSAED